MMFIHLVMVVVQLVMVLIQVAQASGSGAETRRGTPCWCPTLQNGGCRLHGGNSTGPKTPEGRKRICRSNWWHGRFSSSYWIEARHYHATRKKLEIDGGPPQGSQLVCANLLSGASSGSPFLAIPSPGTIDHEPNQQIASDLPSRSLLQVLIQTSRRAKSLNEDFSSTGNEQTRWKANYQPRTEPSDRFRCRRPLSPEPEQTFCIAKNLNVYFSSIGIKQGPWRANHQPKTELSDRFRCRQPLSPAPEQTFCIAKSLNVYFSSTGIKQLVAERSQAQRHLYRPAGGNGSYLLAERLYVLRTPPVLGGGPDLWSALRDQVGSSH